MGVGLDLSKSGYNINNMIIKSSGQVTIYYIDQNPENLQMVKKYLAKENYKIIQKNCLEDVLTIEIKDKPNLILVNINQLDIEDFVFINKLKAVPHLKDIPIVALFDAKKEYNKNLPLVAGCQGVVDLLNNENAIAAKIKRYLKGEKEKLSAEEEIGHLKEYNFYLADGLEDRIKKLEKANAKLKQINEIVEFEIKKRTNDLLDVQEQLMQSSRLVTMGKLVAGLTHELNNPVTALKAFLQIIKKNVGNLVEENPKLSKILDNMDITISHLEQITERFLRFSKRTEVSFKPVSLNSAIEEALVFVDHQISKKDITIVKELDENLPLVKGDKNHLVQVFVNLAINAVQAMDEGKKLTLKSYKSQDKVIVEVQDEGKGISKKSMDNIFQPFFSTKGSEKGTGLGLSITRMIVDKHLGSIKVDSKIGKGTTFTLRFSVYNPK